MLHSTQAHQSNDIANARKYLRTTFMVTALFLSVGLAACNKNANPNAGQKPDPVVSVLSVEPTNVILDTELSGRLQPIREALVVAQATGVVKKRLFTEGSMVKEGQALFQIDNAPYLANLETARASLATAQANLAKASADVTRYRPLVKANAISKQEFDAAVAQERLARAQIQSANAAIRSSQINVGYARVSAPISGRIGKALVSEGALVSQASGTQLARIQQTDSLYVDINQSAASIMQLRQAMSDGKIQMADGNIPVTIVLDDGTEYPIKGRLLFTDLTVDESTGQVTLRAEIPNPGGVLMPGMFVQVKIPQTQVNNAVLIPQQAVSRGTSGDTVMVVNEDGSYAPRPVTISRNQGNNWVITGGLNAGDKVIIDGMAIVQMSGAKKVKTQPWQNNAQPTAPQGQTVPQESQNSAPTSEHKDDSAKPADSAKQ